jgi:phage repressor protein C with HTH and peptisase S24 domain
MKLHFDVFYKRVCEATGVSSQGELARVLGVNRSAVTQAKNRGFAPEKWIFKLSRDYGLNPDWLAGGEGGESYRTPDDDPDFKKVPKVNARLAAGGGSFEVGGEVEDYYAFRRDWISRRGNPDSMVLMDIFGNSMEPEIKEGDTALIDQSRKEIIAGGVYAVGIEDTVLVKRIEKRPGSLVLISDNREYEPVEIRGEELDNARIIGKVVWTCREYR